MRIYIIIGVVAVLAAAVFTWWSLQKPGGGTMAPTTGTSEKLAPEVEDILSRKTGLLLNLAADPGIVTAVNASNEKNVSLSQADIKRLDQEWQNATGQTPLINSLLTNETARLLIGFQYSHPEFKEIFVADAIGLNVGQTDKTSDYYQADEAWWVQSYNNGRGHTLHGAIEFDESSQTEAISIYVPVMDGVRAIGVIKGVLDLAAISGEL